MPKVAFLLLFLPGISISQGIENPPDNTLKIAGHIENATQKTLTVISLELMGRENHMVKLMPDGTFNFEMPVLSSHGNYIRYNKSLISFFANPGDSIYLKADEKDFKGSAIFYGDNQKFNECIKAYGQVFGKLMNTKGLFSTKLQGSTQEFMELITEFKIEMETSIDSIFQLIQPDKAALEWMKSRLKYRIYDELLEYGRIHKEELNQKLEDDNINADYYDFTSGFESSNASDLLCSGYYESFFNEYYDRGLWPILAEYRQLIDSGLIYTGYQKGIEIVETNVTDQISKELILTRMLNELIKDEADSVEIIGNELMSLIKTKILREIIQSKLNIVPNDGETNTIEDLAELDFVGVIFEEIQKLHQDKVLYIDLWGTWCKPCLQEFPSSSKLYDELNGEPIEFIYLGCQSDKTAWERSIDKYGLSGTHYLLTNDQFAVLGKALNVNGIPRYLIIDRDGIIIDPDATRPSDRRLRKDLISLMKD
ncbi:MAG: TlpA family protein disulfide reductase [Bacteroidota bacterium]